MKVEKMEPTCSPVGADFLAKYATTVTVEVPQDVAEALRKKWGDLSEYALEILAVEGYRSGALTPEQLHRVLSLRTRP